MIRIALVRGSYLNHFEGQNYAFDRRYFNITGISSKYPIHSKLSFPVEKLPSLADFRGFPLLKFIANRTLGDVQILFGLENLRDKFDIFHTADPHYYYSYQLAKMKSKNLIRNLMVTSWDTIPFNNESVGRKKFIKRFTQKWADRFICYTDKAKDALIKEEVNTNKIDVIRLGVDLNKFKMRKIKKDEIVILFVGRLVEEKGIMDLYEAFKNVRNVKLRIIGNGPLKSKLKSMTMSDGLSDAVKIEQKNYEAMPKVYQEADIFVLPSKTTKTWEEQYGMVLVEAMASGLPVIASKTGAISEVIGDWGILVKEGDVEGLTKALVNLLKDANLRRKIGRMGRIRAEKLFDCKKTAKKIEKIYENISGGFNKK